MTIYPIQNPGHWPAGICQCWNAGSTNITCFWTLDIRPCNGNTAPSVVVRPNDYAVPIILWPAIADLSLGGLYLENSNHWVGNGDPSVGNCPPSNMLAEGLKDRVYTSWLHVSSWNSFPIKFHKLKSKSLKHLRNYLNKGLSLSLGASPWPFT